MSDTSSNTKPILTMGGTEFTPKQLKQIQTFTQDDLKLIDKVTFVLVFGIMLIGEYVILQRPELMYIYYIMLMVPLIGMRLYIFALNKWHYFLLDFCYVTNIIIAQLIIRTYFTHQPIGELIQIAFVLANGPLLTAIPVWNNSLVFHDFDKVISCSIHFLPSMVVYCIRWYSNIEDIPENLSFTYGFVYPLIIYGIWQIFYLIVTEYLRKDYIFENGCMTSVRWLTEEKPHVAIDFFKRLCFNKPSPLGAMIISQLVMHVLSTFPWLFFYSYRWANGVYMIFCFTLALWNGANYYFEVFVTRYARYIKQFQTELND